MSTYFKSFIKGHSQLTRPLRKLLTANTPFVWMDQQEAAFNRIKEILVSDVILEYPDLNEQMNLETDASTVALGYVLKQVNPVTKKEKVIESNRETT